MKNIKSFSKIHTFFNSKLPELYESKEGKKIIANYIKLIKEDKVLRQQYELYTQLEEGVSSIIKESTDISTEYVNELLTSFKDITTEQFVESNNKLFYFLIENKVITEWETPWGRAKKENKKEREYIKSEPIFESVDYLLYMGKSNLSKYIEKKNILISELRINKRSVINEEKTVEDRIREFNEKYENKLTVEELNIVRDLIKMTQPQQGILQKYQKSVLSSIDGLIGLTEDVELKDKYLKLKEQVLFEDYANTEKICKLFEIRQVVEEIKINK